MSDSENREELLKLLEAQGKAFLQHFSLPPPLSLSKAEASSSEHESGEDNDEEWGGIEGSEDSGSSDEVGSDSDFEQEDDDFVAGSSTGQMAPVVVFAQSAPQSKDKDYTDKVLMRSFMSSKISKHRDEVTRNLAKRTAKDGDDDDDDERTNAQNDAMLHKLIHTKLLSGSLNPSLNLSGAERRKALEGRILEMTGAAKLGKGEHVIRSEEHRRAAKRVREGISEKRQERQRKELEQAKHEGNYHPALKKLFEASSAGPPRKREAGMKMGVGRFSNGKLRLTREDIAKVQGPRQAGPPRKKRRH